MNPSATTYRLSGGSTQPRKQVAAEFLKTVACERLVFTGPACDLEGAFWSRNHEWPDRLVDDGATLDWDDVRRRPPLGEVPFNYV